MPITTLDPATALIIVDLQAGIVGLPTVHPAADVIRNAAALAQAFRQQRRPVVLVNVTATAPGRTDHTRPPIPRPAGWDAFIPELQQAPTDHVVTKRSWGAFMHTDLHAYLQAAGVTQVVIAAPSVPAASGASAPGWRHPARNPTNCSTMMSGPGVVSANASPSSMCPGVIQW